MTTWFSATPSGSSRRAAGLAGLAAVALLALAAPCSADPVELHRVTGGNPFFVTEVLAAANGSLPRSVREAVLSRAARLTPPSSATALNMCRSVKSISLPERSRVSRAATSKRERIQPDYSGSANGVQRRRPRQPAGGPK